MPAPQATLFKQLVRTKFMSFAIKVPPNWQQPTGDDAKMWSDSFKDNEKSVPPAAPPLFLPASPNKYHVDTQKQHIKDYGDYMDGISDAICSAWGEWQRMATMVGIMINGPTAAGGQVVGPPLAPLILKSAPKSKPNHLKYSTAIANVLGTAWLAYTATIKVPGLPLYPAFTMVTAPVAPPMPNQVTPPIGTLTQVTVSLAPPLLKTQMVAALADPQAPFHDKLFEAIVDGFDKSFKQWQLTTMVTQITGTGPVPTFAPPLVLGGPVVAGIGVMAPGGFS